MALNAEETSGTTKVVGGAYTVDSATMHTAGSTIVMWALFGAWSGLSFCGGPVSTGIVWACVVLCGWYHAMFEDAVVST